MPKKEKPPVLVSGRYGGQPFEWFDDCAICQYVKKMEEEGRPPEMEELEAAFRLAKMQGGHVGGPLVDVGGRQATTVPQQSIRRRESRQEEGRRRKQDRCYVLRVTLDIKESPKMEDGTINRKIRQSRMAPVREVALLDNQNLYTLAEAINDAFGFAFDHCFGFFSTRPGAPYHEAEHQYELFSDLPDVEPTPAASVEKTFVHEVWEKPGDRMSFLFDYGDMWWFTVELARVEAPEKKRAYPWIVRKEGRSPQQYPPAR